MLVRHGLGSLADLFELRVIEPIARERRAPVPIGPVRLRRALEELGTTFIKLGQVLSTRPDIVPPDYEVELARLQDGAPTIATAEVVAAVERSLGRPVAALFASFDPEPIAAASIGQVHAATLPDGSEVVVKVRRPGVVERVRVDLDLLERVARRRAPFGGRTPLRPARPRGEFGATLLAELDYVREGRNAELVATGFAGNPRVHVPSVIWDRTCDAVITEERVRGTKVDDVHALEAAGLDRSAVARDFADAYLSMVFLHGFFHADPHPGNVFVESGGRIGFVDFGMVGSVEPGDRTRTRFDPGRRRRGRRGRDGRRLAAARHRVRRRRPALARARSRADAPALLAPPARGAAPRTAARGRDVGGARAPPASAERPGAAAEDGDDVRRGRRPARPRVRAGPHAPALRGPAASGDQG